jgi:chemotaxis family two-component system response regulator Rcp1
LIYVTGEASVGDASEPVGGRGRPAEILLVEDDEEDALMTRRALERSRLTLRLTWLDDGEKALALLRREPEYALCPRPDMVLLDLNMPKMDGYQVLDQIRGDPALTHLPVVILTTSRAEEDVARGYALHANAYIAKPVSLNGFVDVLAAIDGFWFTVVLMPVLS